MNEQNLILLRELLVKEFNEDQLIALCHDIGLNYNELPGMGPYGKTREIIEAAQARHLIPNLMARVRALRPEAYRTSKIPEVEPDTPPPPVVAPPLVEPQSLTASPSTPPVIEPQDAVPADAAPVMPAAPRSPAPDAASALSPRVRAIAVVVAVALLAVAALTILLRKPAASPAPTATVPETNATPLFTAVPTVEANVLMTPDVSLTATEAAPVQSTVEPNSEVTPAQSVSETHPAAQAVTAINDQLIEFYTGKATADDIKANWGGKAYQVIINFAYKTIKSKLGVDLTRGKVLEVSMHYDRQPALVTENGDTATVSTREYWGYTNPTTKRSMCDTRDYTYTLTKNGDKYQITDLKSKLVSAKCQP